MYRLVQTSVLMECFRILERNWGSLPKTNSTKTSFATSWIVIQTRLPSVAVFVWLATALQHTERRSPPCGAGLRRHGQGTKWSNAGMKKIEGVKPWIFERSTQSNWNKGFESCFYVNLLPGDIAYVEDSNFGIQSRALYAVLWRSSRSSRTSLLLLR